MNKAQLSSHSLGLPEGKEEALLDPGLLTQYMDQMFKASRERFHFWTVMQRLVGAQKAATVNSTHQTLMLNKIG